jgi:hypothetical protein
VLHASTQWPALLTTILADGINLGLSRMAEACRGATLRQLAWVHDWHIRKETYAAALSRLINAHRTIPLAQLWGMGTISSSDGQYFRAGGRGEKLADINARHGNEPGVTFYTHLSDQFGPYYTKVIAATASEAPHVLDGLLYHQTGLQIEEHYTDTGGATDHVFGLCHLFGFRCAAHPRFKRSPPILGRMVWRWRYAKLGASSGRFSPWIGLKTCKNIDLRRRANAGLNKGEARNALARALSCLHPITDPDEPVITVDNIKIAQFIYLLLNNKEIRDVIDTVGRKGVLLLGRFTGDYHWDTSPTLGPDEFRPLRTHAHDFTAAAYRVTARIRMLLLLGGVATLIYFVSAGETGRGCSLTVNMRIFQPSPSRT